MDDKPSIEYHPFGTISLNFDDLTIKLRRCRLGDLQAAKDLLEELRVEMAPKVESLRADLAALQEANADERTSEDTREAFQQLAAILGKLDDIRQDSFHRWLHAVIERMGDHPAPPKEDWPVDLFHAFPIDANDARSGQIMAASDILNHWQSRPLASGRISPNGTMREAAISPQSPPDPSYPPAPLPQ